LTVKRRYLTEREVERLMDCARKYGRYGHRDATMMLVAYRHGLRASVTAWIKGELESLRGKQEKIIAETNEAFDALGELDERQGREDAQRDETIRQLKAEFADFKVRAATGRVEDLDKLHGNLVRSAEASMRSFESAAQRAEMSAVEWSRLLRLEQKRARLRRNFENCAKPSDHSVSES
jgi:hypothetical protein